MKNNTLIIICALIALTLIAITPYFYTPPTVIGSDTVWSTKTDTLWKDTIIYEKELVPKYIYKIKTDTVYDENNNPIELVTENKVYDDTIVCEKDTAELQIFTSGIKSSVDSVSLRLKKSEITTTNTVEITKYIEKPKKFFDRFHLQPQLGMGYGLTQKTFDVYMGIGIGVDLW